ncbi:hypothetical protein P3342_008142 [Pyrenophora teres f. teres]|nr:hypothetical protein P3342_008142 [Pyrenophora teres f. teres]
MAFEVSYDLENEQQFWDELDDIVSTRCHQHDIIDNSLRSFLNVTTNYKCTRFGRTAGSNVDRE